MHIFLAETDQHLRLAIQMLLNQEAGMEVVGVAVQAEGLLVQVEASKAEALMIDWQLRGASMPDLLFALRGLPNPPIIIVLSVDPGMKDAALAAGADVFISKNAPPDELLEIIQSFKKSSVKSSG